MARHIPPWDGCPADRHNFYFNKLGQLVCATTNDTKVDFAYDVLNRVLAETQSTADGHSQTLRFSHDVLGNRTQCMLPDGQTIDTLFYGSGHWHQLAFNGHPLADVERDDLHREIHRAYGTGTRHRLSHALTRSQSFTALGPLDHTRFHQGGS